MRSIFPLSRCQRNLILLFSRYKTLCKTRKNTREFHLYCWDHVRKLNEWCSVDCFYREFRFFNQIMVRDYCIVKCKKFSARAIFFAIQNIYVNPNPALINFSSTLDKAITNYISVVVFLVENVV